ncbi:hypothetical protein ADK55_05760 [Streptomyces sp. WM4235]|nr:hypothetical protein ADK55_05760 [Streptomyces sp. WM4235]
MRDARSFAVAAARGCGVRLAVAGTSAASRFRVMVVRSVVRAAVPRTAGLVAATTGGAVAANGRRV